MEPPALPASDTLNLRTERLDLIPITTELAPAMFELLKDPLLYKYLSSMPPPNLTALTRKFEVWERRRSPDGIELWLNWALRPHGDSRLIGHLQAGVSSDYAVLAWLLGVDWQHQGLATEAAKAVVKFLLGLGVCEIRASIRPDHTASIKVAERLGLRPTNECVGGEVFWKWRR